MALEILWYLCCLRSFALSNLEKDLNFHFLIGALNKDKIDIMALAGKTLNVFIQESVSDMRNLISSMDIVVSVAESTMYEVCACGVLMITYVMADNPISGDKRLEKRGLAINIGDVRNNLNGTKRELASDAIKRFLWHLIVWKKSIRRGCWWEIQCKI